MSIACHIEGDTCAEKIIMSDSKIFCSCKKHITSVINIQHGFHYY